MAFNVGAGLAAMGESVAKYAGAMGLEAQRAELQRESLTLANELATERESKGRKEQHGYSMETLGKQQEFDKWRVETTEAGANARNAASTGASLEAARIGASNVDKQIAATLQAAAKPHIDNEGNVFSINVATGKVEPLKAPDGQPLTGRDPEVAKAMTEVVKAKTAQLRDLTSTYVPQIQALETTLRKLESDPLTAHDKTAQQELAATKARMKALQDRFNAEKAPITRELDEYGRWLKSKSKAPGGTATGDIDWSKYRLNPAPGAAMPPGLADSWDR